MDDESKHGGAGHGTHGTEGGAGHGTDGGDGGAGHGGVGHGGADHGTERHCDVCIVGGSAAGLAAALQLGRQRRSVIVVDSGTPRNAAAAHMHGYLSHDGVAPEDLAAIAREEVRSYGCEVLAGTVTEVTRTAAGAFRAELGGGTSIVARRILVATGVADELPDIAGLAEHWGRDAVHCPFCHGYEVRDRRVVAILTHPMGLHPAELFRQLTGRLTVVVHDASGIDGADLDALRAGGVAVRLARVRRIAGGADGRITAVELADGELIAADAVVVTARSVARVAPFAPLGLQAGGHREGQPGGRPDGLGDVVQTDPTGATAVPGVYAAGNVTDPSQQVLQAAASGSRVGAVISADLAREDLRDAVRPTATAADWDRRYSGEQLWSGNPNDSLVLEVSGLTPGRALDVGAGEGGDACWLAERGWQVTASDISARALERVRATARDRALALTCLQADANALDPFESRAFDLVSAQYASIPRTPDGRGIGNILDAVAPGGTLLVVGHDLEAGQASREAEGHGVPFDPDAYVRVGDVAAALSGSPAWRIEVHEVRPRPAGAAAASHHVNDVVLRARRVAG